MEPMLVYQARVEDGKLVFPRRSQFARDLFLYFEGMDIDILVRKRKRRRTVPMNNYYWGVLVPCVAIGMNDVGYKVTAAQVHELLLGLFAKEQLINYETGEVKEIRGSTATMTITQMQDYWAAIREWAREYLNITIPLPGEQTKFEFDGTDAERPADEAGG